MNISAIILAGGKSKRMKYNKEYIKINGEYLVHTQIKKLSQIFKEIIVVSSNKEHYKDLSVKVVSDKLSGNSPIIGLHAGLIESTNNYNFVIACDMPNISLEFIDFLEKQLNSNKDAYVVKINRYIEPFQSIFSKKAIPVIEKLVKEKEFGFQNMVKQINTYYLSELEISSFLNKIDLFKNINSEAELFNTIKNYPNEYKLIEITKITKDEEFNTKDKIIIEYPLNLYINNKFNTTIMTTPSNLEFLIIGYLYNNDLINNIYEIKDISFNLEENKVYIEIIKNLTKDESFNLNNFKFNLQNIMDNVNNFNKESDLFKKTGAVHSSKLIYDTFEFLVEDISRHNTIDKITGYILKNNLLNRKKYIITSGRISSSILQKCIRSNIYLIVSRGAPTDYSIKLANKHNITILGFARGNNVNIYTHKERIEMIKTYESN